MNQGGGAHADEKSTAARRPRSGACGAGDRNGRIFPRPPTAQRVDGERYGKPETYNLLGISYEKEGNLLKASRFYRVAYYMDQTFQAAADNLERVCQFWRKDSKDIQWGLSIDGR